MTRWARYDRDSSGLYTTLGTGNSNCRQRGILIVANHGDLPEIETALRDARRRVCKATPT